MVTTVTMHEAKTHLSRLVRRALAGEEIVIANRNTPQVRLVPVTDEPRPKRRFGSMKGQVWLDDRFFEPLPEDELRRWEGHED